MEIYKLLKQVRAQKPLVHHITNWVTIYDCANIVKVFGASPVMAHAKEEVADMVNIASALVLNIGTLTSAVIESMIIAGKAANNKGIPVILDVCGAGATKYRDEKSFEILDKIRVSIIKGNSSEIARIAGKNIQTKGVDATEDANSSTDLVKTAKLLADARDLTVVITGKEDIIVDNKNCFYVKNGCDMMANVVGTGCMATSVIGTFAAVSKDLSIAAASGLCCYEIAAELAASQSKAPASFKQDLLDCIFHLNEDNITKMQKVSSERVLFYN